ncbi:MAG: preprotein translocase subunit SecE [Tenericutes bacterium]|jgi:preprotein translocase SecE subunit|nr:preprotein translocase subunit SecE [Mycoplasmatota bacterium]CCZ57428.1 preprotein translocase subunit [Clostridium sp. CAG:762]
MKKIARYFSGVKKEISRVRWLSKKNLVKFSIATISFVVFFSLYFYAIDYITAWLRTL